MFDAFAQWNRLLAAGASMRTTSVRAAETFGGANKVVAARGAIIGEAMRSPWTADHAELGGRFEGLQHQRSTAFAKVANLGRGR